MNEGMMAADYAMEESDNQARSLEIPQLVDSMDYKANELLDLLGQLMDRLRPVMGDSVQEDPNKQPGIDSLTPLGASLSKVSMSTSLSITRVRRILNQLEV